MRYENKALRDLARNAPCMFGLEGCDGGGETSVWVHSDFQRHGKGKGLKSHDFFGAIGCAKCHSVLPNLNPERRLDVMFDAIESTIEYMWTNGLVQVTGHVPRDRKPQRLSKILPRSFPPAAA